MSSRGRHSSDDDDDDDINLKGSINYFSLV